MRKKKILFVCVHNSARSQIAEELLRKLAGDHFEVKSAGLEAGQINPLAVAVLQEIGIDIAHKKTQSVFDLYKCKNHYHYVITVCDQDNGQRCPIFPNATQRLHWSFADPSQFLGSWEQKLAQTRQVRNQIHDTIRQWLATIM